MPVMEKLRGIIGNILSIGLANVTTVINLKNNAGVFEARNAADAAYIVGRGADPVTDDDWVTLRYYKGAVNVIQFNVALVTASSTTLIPANAQVLSASIEVLVPYTGGTSLTLGNVTIGAAGFMAAGSNDPTVVNTYTVEQDTDNGAAAVVVRCTVAGGPIAGSSKVSIWYTEPEA